MNRKLLATTICSILALSASAGAAFAQESETSKDEPSATEPDKVEPKKLDRIVVTGSLIPQAQLETASPVTTITAEDIQRQGYRNVSDVLRAQPLATGAVQDNQFSAGFTPGATTISLLGLAPGFTLVLIDGRPLADYPLLYNGQSNFTDLSSIPTGMVERIDILPGNQSAIYGSAAIAGVVNIILKKHLEGTQLNLRVGGYDDGGGENLRFQVTGGQTWDKLDVTYGLQYSTQEPIFGYQRDRFDSTNDNPNPLARFGSRTFLILDGFTGRYIAPSAATCAGLAGNFDGTTIRDFRPGRGFYCGSRSEPAYGSILNEETGTSLYVSADYQLSSKAELYASVLVGANKTESNSGSRFWSPDINGSGGFIFDDRDFSLNLYQHIFSPEETGGPNNFIAKSISYNAAFGVRGTFGGSSWDYDAYYSRSQYDLKDSQLWPLTDDIEDFFRDQFLGPQLGTYYGYPVYHPDQSAFYQALTPEEYASFLGNIRTESTTWTHNANFVLTNTNLWELPAGWVGVAGLAQVGYQVWNNPTDPRVIAGDFWGITGTQGSGRRSSAAVAVEFRIPLLKTLTANLSSRYDKYKNIDAGDDARATYKLGLEFRPLDTLLIRGNYATAFRAPDMSYIYAGDSGFFVGATDFYRCEQTGQPLDDCEFNGRQIQGRRQGNLDLKSITANSFGYGFVWSPSKRFDIRADYYNINIDNEVNDLPINNILFNENECRRGRLQANSPTCIDVLGRVDRNPAGGFQPDAIQLVRTNPVNISKEKVRGVVSGANFRWGGGRNGKFEVGLDYNVTLDHTTTLFPGDPEIDYLRDPTQSTEFKNVLSGDFIWEVGRWSTSVHGTRYGSTPNFTSQLGVALNGGVGPGRIGGYTLFNLNVGYALTDDSNLTLTVNNLGNRRPPEDPSYTAYPYYNIFNYNGYGRALWLQYDINLGGRAD